MNNVQISFLHQADRSVKPLQDLTVEEMQTIRKVYNTRELIAQRPKQYDIVSESTCDGEAEIFKIDTRGGFRERVAAMPPVYVWTEDGNCRNIHKMTREEVAELGKAVWQIAKARGMNLSAGRIEMYGDNLVLVPYVEPVAH